MESIPVNVFTGFLGSGKTTVILNLTKHLPEDYNVVLLKNEFGNVQADSELAKENNVEVREYVNGCLCCVLLGKLQDALNEIIEQLEPDRIIIETSGSAYPGPIAWEIRKMGEKLKLDSIVTVIDAVNFEGYKDKSYTAQLQTEDTDLIMINKHEKVSERDLDDVLDDVYELNPHTPKIRTDKGEVNPDLVFGLDSKLFMNWKDKDHGKHEEHKDHHEKEVDIFEVITDKIFTKDKFSEFLDKLDSRDFYRIKGMIQFENDKYLLNYVFGKYDYDKLSKYKGITKLVFMGRDLWRHYQFVKDSLELSEGDFTIVQERKLI